ncbi:MAG TPA: glucokinase [Candidatus Binatia bacterium]|jgi:glucokinase
MILAGDIGGTKTNLALYSVENDKLVPSVKNSFPSKNYPSLEAVLREFMTDSPEPVAAACFGVAGPVIDGTSKTPNLPWFLDAREIARCLDLDSVGLINDLEATGYGAATLDASEFFTLHAGRAEPHGAMGLIAAGTGLGEAMLCWKGQGYGVLASEGGHADFAARTQLEIELLAHLIDRFGHVSYERVVSGPGIFNIYSFLKDAKHLSEPAWLKERLAGGDPSAVISAAALANEAEICVQALDIFVSCYGAEAGNLALRARALGGIYVGGGIAPKILPKLNDGRFMRAFTDKGRYGEFLARIPVHVIMNQETALRGAASCAAAQLKS